MTHPLAALIAGVKVKPLEWRWNGAMWLSDCGLGKYRVAKTDNPRNDRYMVTYVHLGTSGNSNSHTIGYVDGVEAAKAAAQADYEARILAALEAAPVPDLVDVLAKAEKIETDLVLCFNGSDHVLEDAADTIRALIALATAQAAQIAGLEDKLAFVQRREIASNTEFDEVWSEAQAEADTLRAEVERLRGALKQIIQEDQREDTWHYWEKEDGHFAKVARAALEGEKPDKWQCPINYPGCKKNCGGYGCGN